MKKVYSFVVVCLFLLACGRLEPVSPVDPLPFPMDENKDLSMSPGDDFYQYCNGSWLKTQPPVPAGDIVGSMYDANPVMNQRINTLSKEVPSLKHYFDLANEMDASSEEARHYIEEHKASIHRPASQAEAFREMGAMVMNGVTPFETGIRPYYVDGRIVCILVPQVDFNIYDDNVSDQLIPASKGQAEAGLTALRWIAEGMGIDLDNIYTFDSSGSMFAPLMDKTPDELYEMMLQAWNQYDRFLSRDKIDDFESLTHFILAYPLSYELVRKYVSENDKQRYLAILETMRSSFRKRIEQADWMSNATKNNALDKLDRMKFYVAYPDQWHKEGLPDITGCKTFVEAVHVLRRSQQWVVSKLLGTQDVFNMAILGTFSTEDGSHYPMDLSMANAFYEPTVNGTLIYPALLLPPLAQSGISEARIYASFAVVGHEFTHGFDNLGAQYDAAGRKHNWWTVADKMAFEDRQKNLVRCYDNLEADPDLLPGQYGPGERTLPENIADLGGFLIALDAYKEHLEEQGYFGSSYENQLRRFYEGFADFWRLKYSKLIAEYFYLHDTHSLARQRVNGVVMNTDLWYELYDVTRDNQLYLPPERRTKIW